MIFLINEICSYSKKKKERIFVWCDQRSIWFTYLKHLNFKSNHNWFELYSSILVDQIDKFNIYDIVII